MLGLADRVKIARTAKGWSQSQLAREVGIKPQAIQAIEAGKVRQPQNIVGIARALGVEAAYLLSGTGPGVQRTKIVGVALAGVEQIDYSIGQDGLGDTEPPEMATEHTVALEVRGNSMGGRIEDGDLVFYDERREPVTADLLGRVCVIGCSDGRVMIKKLQKGSRPGHFHLISYSADPEFDVSVDWAAKVTSIRPR
jgi:transcriptional regulator with XRE-family HTH domain